MKVIHEFIDRPGMEEKETPAEEANNQPVAKTHELSHNLSEEVRSPEIHRLPTSRVPYLYRGRRFDIRRSEAYLMVETGRFRAISIDDLSRFAYSQNRDRAAKDVLNLEKQGLVKRYTALYPDSFTVVTLTRTGEKLLRRTNWVGPDQEIYSGVKKPKELRHDAALYRAYQAKAQEISAQGGRIKRIILDYELKRKLYRDLSKVNANTPEELQQLRKKVAEQHAVPVIEGEFVIPDVRLEYEDRDGNTSRVDLEYVTSSYRHQELMGKARAGFSLYSPHDQAARFHKILDDHQIMAEIFSI